jgi:hypothetical protein
MFNIYDVVYCNIKKSEGIVIEINITERYILTYHQEYLKKTSFQELTQLKIISSNETRKPTSDLVGTNT